MLDALREIILMVKELPEFALWILLGYLLYKLFIIGSIYGVVKLFITKTHDWLKNKNRQYISLNDKFDVSKEVLNEFYEMLYQVNQLRESVNKAEIRMLERTNSFRIGNTLMIKSLFGYFRKRINGTPILTGGDINFILSAVKEKTEKNIEQLNNIVTLDESRT